MRTLQSRQHEPASSATESQDVPVFELTPRSLGELRESVDRRRHKRYALRCPALVFPVELDGTVDAKNPICGISREISESGILLQLDQGDIHVSQMLLIGLNLEKDELSYAGVIVRRVIPSSGSAVLAGAEFGGLAEGILGTDVVNPLLNSRSFAFETPPHATLFENWAQAGIATRTRIDSVLVCPECNSLPIFRRIRRWTDADAATVRLQEQIRSTDEALAGHCLRCGYRFAEEEAHELKLTRYGVRRLDPKEIAGRLGQNQPTETDASPEV